MLCSAAHDIFKHQLTITCLPLIVNYWNLSDPFFRLATREPKDCHQNTQRACSVTAQPGRTISHRHYFKASTICWVDSISHFICYWLTKKKYCNAPFRTLSRLVTEDTLMESLLYIIRFLFSFTTDLPPRAT